LNDCPYHVCQYIAELENIPKYSVTVAGYFGFNFNVTIQKLLICPVDYCKKTFFDIFSMFYYF